jgi:hypothetical protein
MQISSSVAEVGATSPGRAVVLLLRDYVVALLVMLRATEVVMCYLSCVVCAMRSTSSPNAML